MSTKEYVILKITTPHGVLFRICDQDNNESSFRDFHPEELYFAETMARKIAARANMTVVFKAENDKK